MMDGQWEYEDEKGDGEKMSLLLWSEESKEAERSAGFKQGFKEVYSIPYYRETGLVAPNSYGPIYKP